MKRIFISQPMKDKTDEEILEERKSCIQALKQMTNDEIEIIDSFFQNEPDVKTKPLYFLSKSLELLSDADIAVFIGDWQNYRGCKIEYTCAKEYGIEIITIPSKGKMF